MYIQNDLISQNQWPWREEERKKKTPIRILTFLFHRIFRIFGWSNILLGNIPNIVVIGMNVFRNHGWVNVMDISGMWQSVFWVLYSCSKWFIWNMKVPRVVFKMTFTVTHFCIFVNVISVEHIMGPDKPKPARLYYWTALGWDKNKKNHLPKSIDVNVKNVYVIPKRGIRLPIHSLLDTCSCHQDEEHR